MAKPDLNSIGGRLLDAGYVGGIVDMNAAVIDSKVNDLTVAIDFGNAVGRSAVDGSCKAPTADGDLLIGIAARHAIRPASSDGNNTVSYAQRDMVPVLKQGLIYVLAYENVVRGTVALSITAQNGRIASTTGGAAGAGRVAIPGAVWETTTTAGQIGIVRIAQ